MLFLLKEDWKPLPYVFSQLWFTVSADYPALDAEDGTTILQSRRGAQHCLPLTQAEDPAEAGRPGHLGCEDHSKRAVRLPPLDNGRSEGELAPTWSEAGVQLQEEEGNRRACPVGWVSGGHVRGRGNYQT